MLILPKKVLYVRTFHQNLFKRILNKFSTATPDKRSYTLITHQTSTVGCVACGPSLKINLVYTD